MMFLMSILRISKMSRFLNVDRYFYDFHLYLAGLGMRSFDMQETGRESEEPADLIIQVNLD